jgi:valyl-tRNA synthetase
MAPYFQSLTGATATAWGPQIQPPATSANFTVPGGEVFVDLAEHIDVNAEIARLEKESAKLREHIAAKEKKLGNESFTARAPAAVVQQERDSLTELQKRLGSMETSLADLRKRSAHASKSGGTG